MKGVMQGNPKVDSRSRGGSKYFREEHVDGNTDQSLRFKICCLLRVLVRRRATQKAKIHTTRPSSMTRAILNPANTEKIDTISSLQIMFPWLLQLNLISERAIPRSFWIRSLLMLLWTRFWMPIVCLMLNSLVASKRVTESSPPPSAASSISFLFRHVFWQWMPLSYSSLPSQQSIWTYTICQYFCYPQRNQYSNSN